MFEGDVDSEEVRELVERAAQAVNEAVELMAQEVWGNIIEEAPVDEGRLAGSWQLRQDSNLEWAVHTDVMYALFVHEGTGIYGQTGQPITPVSAQVLRFEVSGDVVFATSVSGQEANPYADRALENARGRTEEFMAIAMENAGMS